MQIIAPLSGEINGIQPGSAKSYLPLSDFDAIGVLNFYFMYRYHYQEIVHMFAMWSGTSFVISSVHPHDSTMVEAVKI